MFKRIYFFCRSLKPRHSIVTTSKCPFNIQLRRINKFDDNEARSIYEFPKCFRTLLLQIYWVSAHRVGLNFAAAVELFNFPFKICMVRSGGKEFTHVVDHKLTQMMIEKPYYHVGLPWTPVYKHQGGGADLETTDMQLHRKLSFN